MQKLREAGPVGLWLPSFVDAAVQPHCLWLINPSPEVISSVTAASRGACRTDRTGLRPLDAGGHCGCERRHCPGRHSDPTRQLRHLHGHIAEEIQQAIDNVFTGGDSQAAKADLMLALIREASARIEGFLSHALPEDSGSERVV